MNNNKILCIFLLLFFIISPVNANSSNFIVSQPIQGSDRSSFVYYGDTDDICSEIHKLAFSQEFQDYLERNGINKDDHELHLVSSYSTVYPQLIIHTPHYELHYSITNVTDKSITANNMELNNLAAWNQFTVANRCGETLGIVSVVYYRTIAGKYAPIPIAGRESIRYNLANNDQLNYNPSADFDTATISVFKKSSQLFCDAMKLLVPLGNWHVAYVKKDKNIYIQLA